MWGVRGAGGFARELGARRARGQPATSGAAARAAVAAAEGPRAGGVTENGDPEGEEARRTDPGGEGTQRRLDPDLAARAAARRAARRPPPPPVDTRRYQRIIGLLGLALVIVISISFLTTHGPGTAGTPPSNKLHYFSAH